MTRTPRLEILWFEGCPNREHALTLVQRVLDARQTPLPILSIRIDDEAAARGARFPGSPTVRVDGNDVEPGYTDSGEYALRCRLYRTSTGFGGLPDAAWVEKALDEALRS